VARAPLPPQAARITLPTKATFRGTSLLLVRFFICASPRFPRKFNTLREPPLMRNRNRNDNSRWTNDSYNRDDRDIHRFAQNYNTRPNYSRDDYSRDDMYRDDFYAGREGPYGANSGDHGYNNCSYPEDRDNESYEARLYWRERERLADGRSDRDWDEPRPGSDRAGHIGAGRMAERAAAALPYGRGADDYPSKSTYRPPNFRPTDTEPRYFTGAHGNQVWESDRNSGGSSAGHDHHDADYFAWRNAELDRHDTAYNDWRRSQAQTYDKAYGEWRKARQDKFATEFNDWRTAATQTNQTTSDTGQLSNSGNAAGAAKTGASHTGKTGV